MTKTPAERARDARRRAGIGPREISDHPGLAARRKHRRGEPLTDEEEAARLEYQRQQTAKHRANVPTIEDMAREPWKYDA